MKKHNESCKQGRKKVGPISLNAAAAGGIERVVALGGALAVASIIAAFSMKKGGKKDSIKDQDQDKETRNVVALAPAPAPAPAIESCAKEDDTGEGISYIENESSPTMHQNSCCTNNGTSNAGVSEIETSELVSTESCITLEENTIESESKEDSVVIQQEETVVHHAAEQESDSMTGNHGDIQELSEPVHENENSLNAVHNERLASLGMELIEITIVDESVHVDAEQPTPQPSSPSKEEENSSISAGEQQQEEEEQEEEYSLVQSSFPAPAVAEEEEEDGAPKESSVSTEEEEEEEEEEESALHSSFSTEVEEDENGENAGELDEESSEGTWSSYPEPNMEVIWPAEIMAFISSAPKEVDLSLLESEMKTLEDGKPTKGEPHHYSDRNRFPFDNNGARNNRETGELGVMDVRKQHAAKRQTWFWFGLVVLVLALLANCLLQSNYLSNSISFVFPMK
ncbi:hypothetical protein HRI_001043200 [Hibiscus trionum]|uniref:Uncharacterized protein n=1 Tax=Hibiscus trionum TaxID=183268 RepID=A0A9W7HA37_HIBTR|nr:hypothetical protein HRI_001043200 [Hibiscus trionum]